MIDANHFMKLTVGTHNIWRTTLRWRNTLLRSVAVFFSENQPVSDMLKMGSLIALAGQSPGEVEVHWAFFAHQECSQSVLGQINNLLEY